MSKRERPIIFNAEMVRAVLNGSKTQTRRIIQERHLYSGGRAAGNWPVHMPEGEEGENARLWAANNSPFGAIGDQLYVRETWAVVTHAFDNDGLMVDYVPDRPSKVVHEKPFGRGYYSGHTIYAADGSFMWGDDDGYVDGRSCWKPSSVMPRWASRITLEITGVRVERLHEISGQDALKEGLHQLPVSGRYCIQPGMQYFGGASFDAKEVYSWLWESIYGDGSWQANPWVWVIEFKRVEDAK